MARTKPKKRNWTPEVIAATRKAALAVAELWDALYVFEAANSIELDGVRCHLGRMKE